MDLKAILTATALARKTTLLASTKQPFQTKHENGWRVILKI
jgi:hypothetical protein